MFKSLNGEKCISIFNLFPCQFWFQILFFKRKVNIVDLMFKMIETYTNNLEELVQEKTIKLEDEKKNTEKLLSEMLPK